MGPMMLNETAKIILYIMEEFDERGPMDSLSLMSRVVPLLLYLSERAWDA